MFVKQKYRFFTIALFWMVLDYIHVNPCLVYKYDNPGICWHIMVLFLFLKKPYNQGFDLPIHSCKIHMCKIWQYWLWSFKFGDTKSEKILPKNFENCCSGESCNLFVGSEPPKFRGSTNISC